MTTLSFETWTALENQRKLKAEEQRLRPPGLPDDINSDSINRLIRNTINQSSRETSRPRASSFIQAVATTAQIHNR